MSNAKRPARQTRQDILNATASLVREMGYSALSTRRVAEKAGVPLSQIHYHFGSMPGLLLELLKMENAQLIERQAALFTSNRSLAEKWALACDYLTVDMESGYVRLLHEMIYGALVDENLRLEINEQLGGWKELLLGIAQQAFSEHGNVGPFTSEEVAFLVAQCFLGQEIMMLVNEKDSGPGLSALRKIGELIALYEGKDEGGM